MFVNKKIIKELIDMYKNWKAKNLTIDNYNYLTSDKYLFSKITYINDSIDCKKNGNILDFSFYGRYKCRITFARDKGSYYKRKTSEEISDIKKTLERVFYYNSDFFNSGFLKTKQIIFIIFLISQGFEMIQKSYDKKNNINKTIQRGSLLRLHKDDLLIEYDIENMIFTKAQKCDKIKDLKFPDFYTDFFYEINLDYEEEKVKFFRPGHKKQVKKKRRISPPAHLCFKKNQFIVKYTKKYLYFIEVDDDGFSLYRNNFKSSFENNIKLLDKLEFKTPEKKVTNILERAYETAINFDYETPKGFNSNSTVYIVNNKISKLLVSDRVDEIDRCPEPVLVRYNDFILRNEIKIKEIKPKRSFTYYSSAEKYIGRFNILALNKAIKTGTEENDNIIVFCNGVLGLVRVGDEFYNKDKAKMLKNIRKNFDEWVNYQDIIAMMEGL